MSQDQFKKFVKVKSNAAIKEKHKQDKKIAKKERAAAINKRYEDKRAMRGGVRVEQEVKPAKESRNKFKPTERKAKSENSVSPNLQRESKGEAMPLNKYLAHCGVASRREAVSIVKEGKVTVNGKVVTEPSYKVQDTDAVVFNNKKLFVTKNLVYILLNKPKDYISTTDDPQGRKTVLELLKKATLERIYPVGRLDRNTSGVLLFTNDGEFTQRMTHPSYEIKKVYEAKLDKPLTKGDFEKILNGIKLEDGEIHADALAYADSKDKSIIGIEIHSGRNRIVRRIFESLGYDVKGLDRVMYANLTKKNVERGKWRYLSEKEIRQLKYINPAPKPAGKNKVRKEEQGDNF
jgi:23S rRNA pseudouridine2605 synthase